MTEAYPYIMVIVPLISILTLIVVICCDDDDWGGLA